PNCECRRRPMTDLPASVRITDLPVAGTMTGAELLEAVQTTAGVGLSVQVSASNLMIPALGALPTGGAAGTLLYKTAANNYSTAWNPISSFLSVIATTGLTTSGSTALILS